jgi:TolB-like protein
MGLISELRRRNVFRMAVLYVLAAWLVMQVAEVVIGLANLPEWIGPTLLAVLAVGFPIALVISWFYELTPEGLALEKDVPEGQSITHVTGRRMDFIVIAVLAAGLILLAGDKWWPRGPIELSIAVLPLQNLSSDPEQEYFADGLSEEILNLLSRIRSLKVIARTSSFSFKDKRVDIPTIASQLNTRYVLEGSVRAQQGRIRITTQLIDGQDGAHVWSQTYDRDLSAENLFFVQSEVARAVTDKLRVTLTGEEEERLAKVPTENTEAYTAYLLGRERLRDRKVAELKDAVGQFAQAIELDPQFALAYVGLAVACWLYYSYSQGHISEHCPFADGEEEGSAKFDDVEPLVRKALSIDDEVDEAWVTLGFILTNKAYSQGGGPDVMWLIREAQAAFKKGIDLSPSFSQAYHWYPLSLLAVFSYDDPPNGWLTAWENRHWQSVVERGLEVDPLSLGLHGLKTSYPMYSSTREEAVAHAQRMIEIASDSPQGYSRMAEIHAYDYARLDEAIPWWKRAAERDPENAAYGFAIAESYCALGDAEMAREYAHQATQLLPPDQRTADFDVLIIEACDLLLSGDVYSGRLEEVLQEAGDNSSEWYLNLRAMIDIAAGRAADALSRYKAYDGDPCFDDSGDYGEMCHFGVMRVLQAAGDHERARRFAEEQLKFQKPWFDRFPEYWTSLFYAQGLAVLGRPDEALDVLEARFAAGWRGWLWSWFTLEYDIAFDSIRDHPRFQALIAKVRSDLAKQLENVREMERKGELPTLKELRRQLGENAQ